jgi:hypothetical protein
MITRRSSRSTLAARGCSTHVDDTEQIAIWIGEYDEVGIRRIQLPIDVICTERNQPIDLRPLLGGTVDEQVEMQPGPLLGRRIAVLQPERTADPSP